MGPKRKFCDNHVRCTQVPRYLPGIRCYDSHKGPVVFRHREHMQRLHDSAKIYRFPVSQSVDELMEACREVIRTNNLTSAYIRPRWCLLAMSAWG